MGHQSRFYMTPKDMADFERRLREKTDFIILLSESPTSSPRVVDSVNFSEDGKPWFFKYLARPEDLDAIVMQHLPEQGYWWVQDSPSPVIEFGPCPFDGKSLGPSRLYYVDTFLGPDHEWTEKSEAFRKWAKRVHTLLKKSLKWRASYNDYIGADAQTWVDAGGQLVTDTGQPVTW